MLANILQGILDFFGMILSSLLSALPDSPFSLGVNVLGTWMGWINYFIPIGSIINVMAAYLSAVSVWYAVRWIMRFSKYIG